MLKKFITYVHWLNEDGSIKSEGQEWTVHAIGMIQALERVTNLKHTEGELTEVTSNYWEFIYSPPIYRDPTRRNKLILIRENDNDPPAEGVRPMKRPFFK